MRRVIVAIAVLSRRRSLAGCDFFGGGLSLVRPVKVSRNLSIYLGDSVTDINSCAPLRMV
jgi:hypothetical protein